MTTSKAVQMLSTVRAEGFYPDLAEDALVRLVGSQEVLGYFVDKSVHLDGSAGVIGHVTVVFVTQRRLVLWSGHEAPVAPVGDKDVDTSVADVQFMSWSQTVAMRRVNDVQVTQRISNPNPAAGEASQLEEVLVNITTASLDSSTNTPLECATPGCTEPHGLSVNFQHDTILLAQRRDGVNDSALDKLVAFAGVVENALS